MMNLKKQVKIPRGQSGSGQGYELYEPNETRVTVTYTVSKLQKQLTVTLQLIDLSDRVVSNINVRNISVNENRITLGEDLYEEDDAFTIYLNKTIADDFSWISNCKYLDATLGDFIELTKVKEETKSNKK